MRTEIRAVIATASAGEYKGRDRGINNPQAYDKACEAQGPEQRPFLIPTLKGEMEMGHGNHIQWRPKKQTCVG